MPYGHRHSYRLPQCRHRKCQPPQTHPAHLPCRHRYSCKCHYLRAQLHDAAGPSSGSGVVRPLLVLLYAWAWAVILWAMVGYVTSLSAIVA